MSPFRGRVEILADGYGKDGNGKRTGPDMRKCSKERVVVLWPTRTSKERIVGDQPERHGKETESVYGRKERESVFRLI